MQKGLFLFTTSTAAHFIRIYSVCKQPYFHLAIIRIICILAVPFQAYYYVNDITQESSWDPPEKNQAGQEQERDAPSMLAARVDIVGEAAGAASAGQALGMGGGGLAVTSPTPINNSGGAVRLFPYYVNERGNRVFCVPRRRGDGAAAP